MPSDPADGVTSAAAGPTWRECWYPVAFARDLTGDLHRITVHGDAFVLFRTGRSAWSCLRDRCPHRAARLSDGRLLNGRLECGYHGWQFGSDGDCLEIPQLAPGKPIPSRACVQAFPALEVQGLVWIWPGASSDAEPSRIAKLPDLELPGCSTVDFAIDLPYDQTFLIENVIDIAHIHVAHDGIRGGGRREMAAPIAFDILKSSQSGFVASFRSIGLEEIAGGPPLKAARVAFRAPNLVHYQSDYEESDLHSGLALYSLPLGPDRCRLLYRAYSDFWRLRDRLRPRWLEHQTQCHILEQDMEVVIGQAEEISASEQPPSELWLPLKTSDALVIAYREWLDEHASNWPFRTGFRRPPYPGPGPAVRSGFDRLTNHTEICASCSRAERVLRSFKATLTILIVLFLGLAATAPEATLSVTAAGAAVAAALNRGLIELLRRRFD